MKQAVISLALLAAVLLTSPAHAVTCAPNGTCWQSGPAVKQSRVIYKDGLADVRRACAGALGHHWQINGTILACTVGINLPQPIIILPASLPQVWIDLGWSVALLAEYEQANADGRTDYARNRVSVKR